MQTVCNLIEYLCCKFENAVIWITGDLPNISWYLNSVVSNDIQLSCVICYLSLLVLLDLPSGFTHLQGEVYT